LEKIEGVLMNELGEKMPLEPDVCADTEFVRPNSIIEAANANHVRISHLLDSDDSIRESALLGISWRRASGLPMSWIFTANRRFAATLKRIA
jgi:hypothetical protein